MNPLRDPTIGDRGTQVGKRAVTGCSFSCSPRVSGA